VCEQTSDVCAVPLAPQHTSVSAAGRHDVIEVRNIAKTHMDPGRASNSVQPVGPTPSPVCHNGGLGSGSRHSHKNWK
jgi:hypothetical protein